MGTACAANVLGNCLRRKAPKTLPEGVALFISTGSVKSISSELAWAVLCTLRTFKHISVVFGRLAAVFHKARLECAISDATFKILINRMLCETTAILFGESVASNALVWVVSSFYRVCLSDRRPSINLVLTLFSGLLIPVENIGHARTTGKSTGGNRIDCMLSSALHSSEIDTEDALKSFATSPGLLARFINVFSTLARERQLSYQFCAHISNGLFIDISGVLADMQTVNAADVDEMLDDLLLEPPSVESPGSARSARSAPTRPITPMTSTTLIVKPTAVVAGHGAPQPPQPPQPPHVARPTTVVHFRPIGGIQNFFQITNGKAWRVETTDTTTTKTRLTPSICASTLMCTEEL